VGVKNRFLFATKITNIFNYKNYLQLVSQLPGFKSGKIENRVSESLMI